MAASMFFFSSSVEPLQLLQSAAPLGAGGSRRGGFCRPSPVVCPGRESASGASNGFEFEEGLASVRALLRHGRRTSARGTMTTIDHLKRLCIDHYFHDEIDDAMESCQLHLLRSDDLLEATLSLRLMREAGHQVSPDEVLGRFTDGRGDFRVCHSKDISGLLSLQDTSHLSMGEASLHRAKEFSGRHLRSAMKHLNPNLARYVRHSLDHPYHVSLRQYKARHHLSYLQGLPSRSPALEDLAAAEFQLNKLLHQREMQEINRWWLDLGLAQEIPAARDQIMKWYVWSMTIMPGQSFSRCRIEITKLISFIYIVDDIFDVVATQEELVLFTAAVKMWDLAAAESLPGYMKACYKAIYTVTNDMADMVEKEHGLMNPIDHLKETWAMLFDAFLVEARWLSSNQVPAAEDYLANGVVTSGIPLLFQHLFFLLGHEAAKLTDMASLISCPAKILRLWDDMGSAKDEAQEGRDGSYREVYMRENPELSRGEAEDHMVGMIAGEWEELNRACFSRSTAGTDASALRRASLNSARMVSVMYDYDREQKLPALQEYIRMLLF